MASNLPRVQLTTLPTELLLRIYELLPSFIEAFQLRATCQRLCSVWYYHRETIANVLLLDDFEGWRYAIELYQDQRISRPAEAEWLTDRDLYNLTWNKLEVEQVIESIEEAAIPRLNDSIIHTGGLRADRLATIYHGSDTHPPKLTPSERRRVIRACYQIWLMSYHTEDAVRSMAYGMRPRELLYLLEMATWARAVHFPRDGQLDLFFVMTAVRDAIKTLYLNVYLCPAPTMGSLVLYGDQMGLFVIWDHWQDKLKNVVCSRSLHDLQWDTRSEALEFLWDYEPGDEFIMENP